jgi:hypothetical protein
MAATSTGLLGTDTVALSVRLLKVISTEDLYKIEAAEVPRELHQATSTSSRTRRRRILAGLGWSKKKAETASFTLARNCSQESPCVKMLSVKHSAQKPPSASWVTSNTSSFTISTVEHPATPRNDPPVQVQ